MRNHIFKITKISLITILMMGCTTTPKNPHDPFEQFNRGVYGFNKTIDSGIIKPIAYLYWRYLPQPAQMGIGNFYDNLKDIPNIANDLLQFQFAFASYDLSRFLINSTIGIFGLFDVAGGLGLEHRRNDFGQTLYHWGYKKSNYLVLPFIGPSSFRDGIGFFVDYCALSVWPFIEPEIRYPLLALDAIDTRARLLRTETVLNTVALDEYAFVRDAYFQRRQYLFDVGKSKENNTINPYSDDIDSIELSFDKSQDNTQNKLQAIPEKIELKHSQENEEKNNATKKEIKENPHGAVKNIEKNDANIGAPSKLEQEIKTLDTPKKAHPEMPKTKEKSEK